QGDGKIVAVGSGGSRFALARYKHNASLDSIFGGDGKVTTRFNRGRSVADGVVIQGNGKIIAVGAARDGGRFALARYNADGTLDATFGGNGKVTTSFSSFIGGGASSVAIQGDGKIVAAGATGDGNFALARYNTDGSLDASFDGDGKVTTSFTA